MAFTHREFPYRLDRGNGQLELKDDRLQMDISTYSENQLVHIAGEVRNPGNGPTGWMRITSDELPIDEKLLGALQPQAAVAGPFHGSERNHRLHVRDLRAKSPTGRSISICSSRPAAAGCATIVFPMRSRTSAAKWR